MQKVISINLNGNAFQFEEGGYDALRDYLARADRELKDNPDRAEIMADLEQAIADKCQKYLGPHKSVVTSAEVAQVIAEMGPVSSGSATDGAGQTGAAGEKQEGGGASAPHAAEAALPHPRGRDDRGRLQRHRGVLPAGRHARSRRLRRPRAADQRRRHPHLRRR